MMILINKTSLAICTEVHTIQSRELTALLNATEPKPGRLNILAGSCKKVVSLMPFMSSSSPCSASSSKLRSPKRSGVLCALLKVPQTSEILPLSSYLLNLAFVSSYVHHFGIPSKAGEAANRLFPIHLDL